MKKIIIKESDENIIYDFLQKSELSNSLKKALKNHKTSLGQHPAFPPDEEISFDEKITKIRFNDLKKSIENIDGITDYSVNNIETLLSKLTKECKEKEAPIRENLEKICFKTLTNLFNIPEDVIVFKCKLTDKISHRDYELRLTPESTDDEIEFDDIMEMEDISDQVYKRRLINALVEGASLNYCEYCRKYYLSEIFDLNPKLPELYSKIIKLNNFLLFIKDDIKIDDKNTMQGGVVRVTLGNDEVKSKIDAEALIFPVLLSESIKGFMELFAAHGLPEKKDKAMYVIKKSDFLIAEPWDMRIGPILWDYLVKALGNDNTKLIPNIFTIIVKLPPIKFFKLMREVFGKTKKSKKILSLILKKVEHDIDYFNFNQQLDKKRDEYNSSNNGYINPDDFNDIVSINEYRHKTYGGLDFLKQHVVPLDDDEKKLFIDNNVVWDDGNKDIIIKKAKIGDNKYVYFAYTHRAWNATDNKKEAIKIGKFIKTTS